MNSKNGEAVTVVFVVLASAVALIFTVGAILVSQGQDNKAGQTIEAAE